MNGYLILLQDRGARRPAALPGPPGETAVRTPLEGETGACGELFAWGRGGDVHVSLRQRRSLLVFHGCLQGGPGSEAGPDPERVGRALHNRLDEPGATARLHECAAHFDGSFSLVYVDLRAGAAWALTDRIGSRPVWHARSGGALWLGSHALAFAQVRGSAAVNLPALASFLLYGCPVPSTDGLLRDVRQLGPASLAHWPRDGVAEMRTWHRFRHEPEAKRPLRQGVREAACVLEASARRLLRESPEPALFLSGGLDSRLVAVALCAAGGRPRCVTLADGPSPEVWTARRVARLLDVPHEVVVRDPGYYLRGLPRSVFESGGQYDWGHGHFSEASRSSPALAGASCCVLGDFVEGWTKLCCVVPRGRTRVWAEEEFLREFDRLPLPPYRPQHAERTWALLRPEPRAAAREALRRLILSQYAEVADASSDPRIVGDLFFRWRHAPAHPGFQNDLDVRSAGRERNLMFANDVYDLLQRMPADWRDGRNFGARVVGHLRAGAALLPYANSMLPLACPARAHAWAKRARPWVGRAWRRCSGQAAWTGGSWPQMASLYVHDPAWRAWLDDLFDDPAAFPAHLFDDAAVRAAWSGLCAGDAACLPDVERLISLGVLGRHYGIE